MKKKASWFFVTFLLGGSLWYYFYNASDYSVTIKSKELPNIIGQTIKLWGVNSGFVTHLENEDEANFKQTLRFGDTIQTYSWYLEGLNDSITKVHLNITDKTNSLANKFLMPFTETIFEKRAKKTVYEIVQVLTEQEQFFKVKIMGKEILEEKYCACVDANGTQMTKAGGMMKHFNTISDFLMKNRIQSAGKPMLQIKKWNRNNDSINFAFCFPILKSINQPKDKEIYFAEIPRKESLKAIYNGNYITSDRAWYRLLDYAEKKGIAVEQNPVEIFNTNPNAGGSELNWEAEIFLPLK